MRTTPWTRKTVSSRLANERTSSSRTSEGGVSAARMTLRTKTESRYVYKTTPPNEATRPLMRLRVTCHIGFLLQTLTPPLLSFCCSPWKSHMSRSQ